MSEMTTITPDAGVLASPSSTPASVIQIGEWAAELDAAHRLGLALASSGMVPDSLRKDGKNYKEPERLAADVAVVILAGKSVGLDPMTAVQNIFPVYGKPAMYSRTMVGLAQAQGHEVERTSATASSVTVRARRRGKSEWHSFTWDMDRAKHAGYTSNSLYQKDPIAMLTAKAQAEACRNLFADTLMGMPYSVEEGQLEDMGEAPAEQPKTTVKRKTSTRKKPTPKAEPEPDAEPEGSEGDQPAPELPTEVSGESSITEETWNELNQLAEDKGIESVPKWVSDQLGRTLHGWGEITEAEGDRLLKTLVDGEVQ